MSVKIVFLDRKTLGPNVMLRKLDAPNEWVNFDRTAADQIIDRLVDAEIVVTNKVPITGEILSKLPKLKLVAVAATGTNNIDLAACRSNDVSVCNIKGYAATSVAEHVFATILSLRRNLIRYREEVITGRWQAEQQFCYFNGPIHDLKGATLGLIGTGAIGQAVANIGRTFGMNVVFHSLSGRENDGSLDLVGLDELLQTADVVSLHCPLNALSRNLFDDARFEQMKSNGLLINTARGEIIDIDALARALDAGQIAGAAVDVAPIEPPPVDSPLMKLAARPNFLLTPHIAWASEEAMQALADQLVENIDAFLSGSPIRFVT
jgi:glycerate dehydrogenase